MARMEVEILSWAVTVSAALDWTVPLPVLATAGAGGADLRRRVFDADTESFAAIAIHRRDKLPAGATIAGPAVIGEDETSTLVAAGFAATIDGAGNILLNRRRAGTGEAE
jgi:N-methylhydantoinase A